MSFSFGVTPMESPTVPKAETVSKRYSTKWWRLSKGGRLPPPAINRTDVMIAMEKAEAKMIDRVRLTISLGMVRLKTFTSSFPFKRFHIIITSSAALVVLTPPPVEPGEAPMNISASMRRIVALVRDPMSTVLKPAVLGVTDWKKEAKIFAWNGTSLMT